MKKLAMITMSVAVLASTSVFSNAFAQSTTTPVTRAQVYGDLVRLEQAGYRPSASDDANYPADIQAAEAKVAAQDSEPVEQTGMGAGLSGSSESGTRAPVRGTSDGAACVGPVSFCSVYFGS
jgi:hypothetical protein